MVMSSHGLEEKNRMSYVLPRYVLLYMPFELPHVFHVILDFDF